MNEIFHVTSKMMSFATRPINGYRTNVLHFVFSYKPHVNNWLGRTTSQQTSKVGHIRKDDDELSTKEHMHAHWNQPSVISYEKSATFNH